ncbi:MAG: DUF2786 domain-containing protein [Eubacteriales bacterium]|nr:DUF2786 domain-containing protein [Eubacteriales bacterium]
MDIKEKIAKLLALADSPNEHEAKAALLKARELMALHKLRPDDVAKIKAEEVIRKTVDITCTKLTNSWTTRLAAVIASHYCCKSFRNHYKYEKKVTIGFVGLEEDFEICVRIFRYAYECVVSECKAIRQKYQGSYSNSELRKITNAYGDGFCIGLEEAFKRQETEHNQEWGLVLQTPKAVLDNIKHMKKGKQFGDMDYSGETRHFVSKGIQDGKRFDPSTKLEHPEADSSPVLLKDIG